MRVSTVAVSCGFLVSMAFAARAPSVEYTAKPAPDPIAGAMPGWVVEGGVAVGADPYAEPERQEQYFGQRLGRMGVLPVQLLVPPASATHRSR